MTAGRYSPARVRSWIPLKDSPSLRAATSFSGSKNVPIGFSAKSMAFAIHSVESAQSRPPHGVRVRDVRHAAPGGAELTEQTDQVDLGDAEFDVLSRRIDLIKLTVDGRAHHFAVMAGIGIDAAIMAETDDKMKARVGSAGYIVAAGRALGRLPVSMTVSIDGRAPIHRHAMLIAIGNVGELTGGMTLIPGAEPDDGRLDYYIASPRSLRHWVQLGLRFLTRRPKRDDQVDQGTARTTSVTLRGSDNYQLDGDVVGQCHKLVAEVVSGSLTVEMPAGQA